MTLDAYIRNLPLAYDPSFDRQETRRSRFVFTRHIANLLPLYGRSTGTGKPGMLFFNRGGEPVLFDPIADRKSNAHMLILGPTGSGKSALLVYNLLMMAIHRPRVFIIKAGGSFALLGQYFASLGLAVNQVTMRPGEDVSLPPFADALKLADLKGKAGRQRGDRAGDGLESAGGGQDSDFDSEADETRDLLGEMEISARLMIAGGDAHEDARLTRTDRWLIQQAILGAVEAVREAGRQSNRAMWKSSCRRSTQTGNRR